MKSSAFLVNLSRGGVVDREALVDALRVGAIAGAGLDVFWEEPPDPSDPIFQFNVIATPHIAGATDISARGIMEGVVNNLQRLADGNAPINIVNGVAGPNP
jgi:phosphoglycerate dehydrogenase-like enzyme